MQRERRALVVPGLHVIDEKDAMLARQPWYVEFEPPVAVGGGATALVNYTQGFRDFVCTGWGFTSDTVGFPAAPGRWRLTIEDVQAQRPFQPVAFDVTCVIGGNFGIADSNYVDLPVPWIFLEKSQIRLQFTNRDPAIAAIPTAVLVGYLTDWAREADAAMEYQSLQLKAMAASAGVAIPRQQR